MHDAVWYYAMLVTEVQIQAIVLENLQFVANIMEKAMAGDNKDDCFFFLYDGKREALFLLLSTRKREKHKGNNCGEEGKT